LEAGAGELGEHRGQFIVLGGEDRGDAGFLELVAVGLRDDPASHHPDVHPLGA
jgi:hypothetical protein